jgi:hypothetical protein
VSVDLLRELGQRGPDEAVLLALHGARPASPGAPSGPAGRAWRLAADVEATLRAAVAEAVADAGSAGAPLAVLRPAIVRRLRRLVTVTPATGAAIVAALVDALVSEGAIARAGDVVRAGGSAAPSGPPPEVLAAMDRLERALDTLAPPPLVGAARAAGCPAEGIRALEAAGRIVRVDGDLAYAAAAFGRMREAALRVAAVRPVTPADLRDATGTSRKYVTAVLEELDRQGVLRRTPGGHVVGPRAPR